MLWEKQRKYAGVMGVQEMDRETGIYSISRDYIGPVLHSYVNWVLKEAKRRDIKTLYFLARDGYVLQKIAQMICRSKGMSISCRYLYCSRAALRIPSYHLIGKEAYDLIFLGGYHVSVKSFFERAGIPASKWKQILNEARIVKDIYQELSYYEIMACREKIVQSRVFQDSLSAVSKSAYPYAIGYLKQEGLLGQKQAAVVDSGWTGSMQRSLRQLLESAGFKGNMVGFYFGMFQKPKELQDGEYLAWYFTPNKHKKNKILFCNNLLECFLSAPHGMTQGYKECQGGYSPVLKKEPDAAGLELIRTQQRGILDGAKLQIDRGYLLTRGKCEQILRRLMARPTREEVEVYGRFLFCDDITEGYQYPLADESQTVGLEENLLLLRLIKKARKTGSKAGRCQVRPFWFYGVIALIRNPVKRRLYWFNEYICQWCRVTLR